jgi:hypothetical protein
MAWLPEGFVAPAQVELLGGLYHLRPIRADDTELDMVAVMGSRERLWSLFGEAWGWPPASMTAEADREDLQRHEAEMVRNESFNFALFDAEETRLLGCVYIDPPEKIGADADVCWWVVDDMVDTELEQGVEAAVPEWLASEWPLKNPRYVGRDLTWSEWSALPER